MLERQDDSYFENRRRFASFVRRRRRSNQGLERCHPYHRENRRPLFDSGSGGYSCFARDGNVVCRMRFGVIQAVLRQGGEPSDCDQQREHGHLDQQMPGPPRAAF